MIPLTLALSLQERGDYRWFLPLEGEGLGEGEMSILF
jgi:hypothetical protein